MGRGGGGAGRKTNLRASPHPCESFLEVQGLGAFEGVRAETVIFCDDDASVLRRKIDHGGVYEPKIQNSRPVLVKEMAEIEREFFEVPEEVNENLPQAAILPLASIDHVECFKGRKSQDGGAFGADGVQGIEQIPGRGETAGPSVAAV